jgi:ABC-type branched-subunit amino acid transport system substrate-binding protein
MDRMSTRALLATLVAVVACGCGRESRITCRFDRDGTRDPLAESAWLGAELAREMPQPEWVGTRRAEWCRVGSVHEFPEAVWAKELRAQERRWRSTGFDRVPASRDVDRGGVVLDFTQPERGDREAAASDGLDEGESAPLLIVGASDPTLTETFAPNAFLVRASDEALAVAAAEFMFDSWGHRAAVVVDRRDARMSRLDGLVRTAFRTLGGEIAASFDANDGRLAGVLVDAAGDDERVDAIYLAVGPELVATVLPRIRAAFPDTPLMASDALDHPSVDAMAESADGRLHLTAHAWLGEDATIEASRFASYYRLTYGREPTAAAALAYDAACLAMFAVVKAKRDDPDSPPTGAELARTIASVVNFSGATGRISFRHGPRPTRDVWIVALADGRKTLAGSVMADPRLAHGPVGEMSE